VIERFAQFPRALASRARVERWGDVPVLLAHPDWDSDAPTVIWLHGRTVNKELDPGRYLRWIRAGIAACAVDLPGHGQRAVLAMQQPENTPRVLEQAAAEIDGIIAGLGRHEWGGVFDLSRLALGGMSAGGMVTLRRLCDPHPFVCAAVESTTGWLAGLYDPDLWHAPAGVARWPVRHDPALVRRIDPMAHIEGFAPMPVLALHSEADEVVPLECQRRFLEALRTRARAQGADPDVIELVTWATTSAPQEHSGFGRVANEAKNRQVEFFVKHLRPKSPAESF
jgi:alpha-beta hydrolase superfamily lysophospholipase